MNTEEIITLLRDEQDRWQKNLDEDKENLEEGEYNYAEGGVDAIGAVLVALAGITKE